MIKVIFFALALLLTPAWRVQAIPISIDFEELSEGESVLDQYSSENVFFRDQLDLSGGSPGTIASGGYASSSKSLQANQCDVGIYLLFGVPVLYVDAFVYESGEAPPGGENGGEEEGGEDPGGEGDEGPGGEETVYLDAYEVDEEGFYHLIDSENVSSPDSWALLQFNSDEPIAALRFYSYHEFKIDNITANPVPEPATMLLLGSGLVGLAGFRRKIRKK